MKKKLIVYAVIVLSLIILPLIPGIKIAGNAFAAHSTDTYNLTITGGGTEQYGYFYRYEYHEFSLPYNCDLTFKVTNTSTHGDGLWKETPTIEVSDIYSDELGSFEFDNPVRVLYSGHSETYRISLQPGKYKIRMGHKYFGTYRIVISGKYLPTVTPLSINIDTGESYQLSVKLCDGLTQKWTSSNERIAVVKNGLVRGKSGGTAKITCKFSDGTSVLITVNVTQAELSTEKLLLLTDQRKRISLNGVYGTVSWKSSDSKIATVDTNGMVTAICPGEAQISALFDGKSYSCKVKVFNKYNQGDIHSFLWEQFDEVSFQIVPSPRYFSSESYTNDYVLFEVDEKTNRISSLSLLTDAKSGIGKFTLFGTYPGMNYNEAVDILDKHGWKEYKTRNNYIYFRYVKWNNTELVITLKNNSLDLISYIGYVPWDKPIDEVTMTAGWVKIKGKWAYYKSNGELAKGPTMINGTPYCFDGKGRMITGWAKVGGKWYCAQDSGVLYNRGWTSIDGTWYYFYSDGEMAVGWINDGGTNYYMKSNGTMATGWIRDQGDWYYLDDSSGAMHTGWMKSGDYWYLLKPSGAMAIGWYNSGGTWYYFKSSGVMATGWVKVKDSDGKANWYWFDDSGIMAVGWKLINNSWEYFNASGVWQYTWDGK